MIETNEYSTADIAKASGTERGSQAFLTPMANTNGNGTAALFADDETQRFRGKWTDIQSEFVDEPKTSVERADQLVAETIKRLAEIFAAERAKLEQEWSHNSDGVSTEDLRLALRRYRSFFDRLLSV